MRVAFHKKQQKKEFGGEKPPLPATTKSVNTPISPPLVSTFLLPHHCCQRIFVKMREKFVKMREKIVEMRQKCASLKCQKNIAILEISELVLKSICSTI